MVDLMPMVASQCSPSSAEQMIRQNESLSRGPVKGMNDGEPDFLKVDYPPGD